MSRQPSSRALRRRLVEELEAAGTLTDARVRKAFLNVPREPFVAGTPRGDDLAAVYADQVIVTRTDARGVATSSSSQPSILALMLERLAPRPGHRVLEIGAGTGYNAALLAALVTPRGRVTSVELEPDVAARARAALARVGRPVEVVVGDGRDGWPPSAPYDRIIATASTGTVPRAWFDQLAPDGLVELPLHLGATDLQAVVTLRRHDGGLRSTAVVEGGFMNLRNPGGEGAPVHPANLSVSEHIDGEHRAYGFLSGSGLRTLRPAARRRLAEVLAAPLVPHRRLGRLPEGRSPGLFLRLARPTGAVTLAYFPSRPGSRRAPYEPVAAVTSDGRSLAVLHSTPAGGRRLDSSGDPRAAEVLLGLLDDWRARRRPGHQDLVVDVRFDADGRSVTTTSWPAPRLSPRR